MELFDAFFQKDILCFQRARNANRVGSSNEEEKIEGLKDKSKIRHSLGQMSRLRPNERAAQTVHMHSFAASMPSESSSNEIVIR